LQCQFLQDWFEQVISVHTTLSPTTIPIFLFAPLQLSSQNISSVEKILGGGDLPPQAMPVLPSVIE
jgi:hypothetical protein